MTEYLVTIGVPCYNEAAHIEKCLKSAFSQITSFEYRVVISDNCSTDQTLSLVREAVANQNNLRCKVDVIESKVNNGANENFKNVFERSSSPFFMWLGAHDYIAEGFLEDAVRVLKVDEECSMVSGNPKGVLPVSGSAQWSEPRPIEDARYDFSHSNPIERYLASVASLSNCTIFHSLFRAAALEHFSFPNVPSADHVLISRLLWAGRLKYSVSDYFRRYFPSENRREKVVLGSYEKNSDFFNAYLHDFMNISRARLGDELSRCFSMSIFEILMKRFGVPKIALQ